MNTAISVAATPAPAPAVDASGAGDAGDVLARIGQITRGLHDNLRELGYDVLVARMAEAIPDARDRLAYVARMTEQAANRVLSATDVAMPLQDSIDAGAQDLAATWTVLHESPELAPEVRAAARSTLAYLERARRDSAATKAQLMEIMMAQDFQDLTGQVIKRITELAQGIEQQLVQLLIDFAPAEAKRTGGDSLLNGPQIAPAGAEVAANQGQVDDLLENLGF